MPRIPIEDKHTYNSYNQYIVGNNRTNTVSEVVHNFVTFSPYYPVEGTDQNNRIGRKIRIERIHHEGFIALPLSSAESTNANWTRDTILDGWNGYQQHLIAGLQPDNYEFPSKNIMFSIPLRHMWIEFYDDDFYSSTTADKAVYLNAFFRNLWIQTSPVADSYPSNQTKMLRESTPYTGRFRIIKDTTYWLSPEKPVVHFNEDINFKRTASFDAAGADPTNVHVYSVWIGPLDPLVDYYNNGFGTWMITQAENPSQPFVVASVRGNMKMIYNDL